MTDAELQQLVRLAELASSIVDHLSGVKVEAVLFLRLPGAKSDGTDLVWVTANIPREKSDPFVRELIDGTLVNVPDELMRGPGAS